MAVSFDYKVRDKTGNLVVGQLEGDSLPLVATRLREMGYQPVSITPRSSVGLKTEIHIPGISNRVKTKDVAVATRQLATMVDSGLSIVRALGILADQVDNPELAKTLKSLRLDLEAGSSFSAALRNYPKVFSKLYVTMIAAGEVGGSVDIVLKGLAETMERQVELSRKVRSAMTYPAVVMTVMVIIFLALLIFIVPIFKKLFASLNAPLPLPTKILLEVSHIILSWLLLVVIAVLAAGFLAFRRWVGTPAGRALWDQLKLSIPIFGALFHKVALARFSSTFSSLVASGVPILETLDIVSETSGNQTIATGLQSTKEGVRQGRPLAEGLEQFPVFPALVTQMVDIGEQTGALDDMLSKVADFYNGEVEATVNNLTSILEPLLTVIMGVMVGTMVISLYMPMFTYIKYVDTQGNSLIAPLKLLAHLPLAPLLRSL